MEGARNELKNGQHCRREGRLLAHPVASSMQRAAAIVNGGRGRHEHQELLMQLENRVLMPLRQGPSFSLGALLLVIGLVGTCLSLGRLDPLLGMVAAMMVAPALFRTADRVRELRSVGGTPGSGRKLLIFVSSLVLILTAVGTMIATSAAVAGLACLAGWLVALLVDEPWLPVICMLWGLVIGLPAGITLAARIIERRWRLPMLSG